VTEQSQAARQVFDQLAAEQLRRPGVSRRRMFGRDGLNVEGKFFAFFDRDQLVLKLPAATAEGLIRAGEAFTTRMSPTMHRWVSVPMSSPTAAARRWRQLTADAYAHVAGPTQVRRTASGE
jgi:TfoX/Sxy family transcriptional regulator of competence genes